ncbi:hypothetical protein ZWY2020_053076 [Hordeum vulgare]|nr:hypothetical protein ZWY2020_053076 [Hordeum vulgare]
MDRHSTPTQSDLERMLLDVEAEPRALPLSLLEDITDQFSDESEIGRGGFAVVYKGMLENGVAVAVKKLFKPYIYEKEFDREVECLITAKHKNVIRFIGYCADSQRRAENYNGKFVMADVQHRLLCFEYLPHGTLDKYISDESCGLEWGERYNIISGICKGLHHLHQNRILHLDLKPSNILLDNNMLPKITDFGLARRFDEMQSRAITANMSGTFGYLAPEFCNGEITYRFDLYSLGVIIMEMLTGKRGSHEVDNVVQKWSERLEKSQSDIQLEQVRVCAEIGIECSDSDPVNRPSTEHIINRLAETESAGGYTETDVITAEQAENALSELHHDMPKDSGGTSSENFSFPCSSNLFLDQMQPAQISEVLLPALTKIDSILGDEAAMVIIADLSKRATNLKKLPGQLEEIGNQLPVIAIVIRQMGTVHLTDGIAKSWIGEVRKLAHRVEDVMDKCSYHVAEIKGGGLLKKFSMKRTRYVKKFTEIMDEMVEVEMEIQRVIQMKDQLQSELSTNDHVQDILNLSYHELSGDLRICLMYCTLFPRDYPMSRESLVRLWVAEGFAPSKEENTPEVVAEGILIELIHRKMLEVVENDELGRVNTCKMHDTVRELASSVAKEEAFASADDYYTMIQMGKDVRRLSSRGWKNDTALEVKLPHLRTLLFLGAISPSPGMLSSILSESNYLAILELQDSEVTEVPTSIGSLLNLRYIGLRRTKVKSLPDSIENLSNLHTLDIKQTKIERLPRGVVKIKKLRHLLADRYADEKQAEFRYFIGVQAPKDLSNLEELQTLETVESNSDLAEQLKKLMQLRSVWIDNISASDCANLFATLSTLPLLSSLLLSARDENEALCFKDLQPSSTHLHRLIIRGQWAKGTLNCPIFLRYGENLKYLALSWCHLGEDPLGMLAPHMPNLTYLRLNNMHSPKTLVLSANSYPNLKTLVLKHMHDVSELKIVDGALPCIDGLYIVSLSKLDKVPQGIESLCSLKKLWLLRLHEDFRTQWDTKGMNQKIQHVPEVRV